MIRKNKWLHKLLFTPSIVYFSSSPFSLRSLKLTLACAKILVVVFTDGETEEKSSRESPNPSSLAIQHDEELKDGSVSKA
ncbi:hypothetical protein BEWA_003970 [Theileria equi strain WA]|uniref:Uncharacterized protein n=1 Tax=Theileria equi strain WA TaxID=1537102 RepID=L0B1J9_THEEQ|nr:hypothetical protein BEWA_003970 [Theileria equi strain WA]AFZ80989.1 hypothetical protein BEWA_003970 [Theileria equi strain WA]|eukprot:XP_004830655.1 hypothetical protein BEWA_003970 [Theileria equi strain WA]